MTKKRLPEIEEYLKDAAYWFYRAAGPEDNLMSAKHRLIARALQADATAKGIPLPSPKEIHAYAITIFPPEKVHDIGHKPERIK